MENIRGFNDDDGGDDTDRYKLMYPLKLMNMFISISLFDILPDVTYAHYIISYRISVKETFRIIIIILNARYLLIIQIVNYLNEEDTDGGVEKIVLFYGNPCYIIVFSFCYPFIKVKCY